MKAIPAAALVGLAGFQHGIDAQPLRHLAFNPAGATRTQENTGNLYKSCGRDVLYG
jgi:hypothetical protein